MPLPKRKEIRLKNHDYSQNGSYFITICTKNRQNFFWANNVRTTSGRPQSPQLSDIGKIIDAEINKIKSVYDNNVHIDKYVIMPNHIHLIISLNDEENGRPKVVPTISRVMQQFKGSISKQVGSSIWQKSFYDHIIRNDEEYWKIWEYIANNPDKWQVDSVRTTSGRTQQDNRKPVTYMATNLNS